MELVAIKMRFSPSTLQKIAAEIFSQADVFLHLSPYIADCCISTFFEFVFKR